MNNIQINMIKKLIDEVNTDDKIELYKQNSACEYILSLLEAKKLLGNPKKFGIFMENVAQNLLDLENSINSEHDKIKNHKKIEIKTSTMLNQDIIKNKKTFQFNGIRLDYDYDYLLFQNINFQSIDYYLISKLT